MKQTCSDQLTDELVTATEKTTNQLERSAQLRTRATQTAASIEPKSHDTMTHRRTKHEAWLYHNSVFLVWNHFDGNIYHVSVIRRRFDLWKFHLVFCKIDLPFLSINTGCVKETRKTDCVSGSEQCTSVRDNRAVLKSTSSSCDITKSYIFLGVRGADY